MAQPRVAEEVSKQVLSASNRDRLIMVASPIALLLLWELVSRVGLMDARFFPAPSRIAETFAKLSSSGELWTNLWVSLKRLFWGFLLGAVPAVMLGVAMGMFRLLRVVIDPLISALYPIPKSALVPLFLLIFGLGEASKIALVATGVFFPVIINSMAGVRGIATIYLDVGHNFRASRWQLFWTIALPGAMPMILAGVRLGVGIGLVLIAIAEMIGAKSGLGYMIWNAWEILFVEKMYVGLIVIAMLGFGSTLLLKELERFAIPWQAHR